MFLAAFLRGLSRVPQVQTFNFIPGPGGSSQKLQAGLDTRVIIKTPNSNGLPHFLPAVLFHQPGKHHFQCNTLQRINGFSVSHAPAFLVLSFCECLKGHQNQLTIVQFLVKSVQLVSAPGRECCCYGYVLAPTAHATRIRDLVVACMFLENGRYRRRNRFSIEAHGLERVRAGKLNSAIWFFHSYYRPWREY